MLIAGVILAGGLSRRLGGGNKCLLPLAGRPILAHVIARAAPQVSVLALNANGESGRFAGFGLPVIADDVPGFPGPLAGILAGLDWAAGEGLGWVAGFPADCPFFPAGLVADLAAALVREGGEIACAVRAGRVQPLFGLWPVTLRHALRRDLAAGLRRVEAWTGGYRVAQAAYPAGPADPFFNINTPDDLARAEALSRDEAVPEDAGP
jgi:molybdopterin-guanine dinucleotide biosynthesis protein A